MAYFLVHSFASSLYRALSVLKIRAMSGTRGSSGLGSHNRLHIERRTVCVCEERERERKNDVMIMMYTQYNNQETIVPFEIVSAGLHCDRNISRQMLPLEFIFG